MFPICCNKSRLIGHIPWGCESLGVGAPCVISAMPPSGQEVSVLSGDQRGLRADKASDSSPESFSRMLEVGRESQSF